MRKVLTVGVALVAALSLAACNGGAKQAPAAPAKAAAAAKPPLIVPASFKDDQEKLTFAAQAVFDGYHAQAVPLLEQIMKTSPSAEASRELGTARYNISDYNGAIDAWQKAAEMDPNLAGEMWNNVGNALRDERKVAEAESAYRRALEIEPTRWNAAINLATLLDSQGDLKGAVAVLTDAAPANKTIKVFSDVLNDYTNRLRSTAEK